MARQKIGVQRVVKMTLSEEDWKRIDQLIENGDTSSVPEYFRLLHQSQFKKKEQQPIKWRSF